MTPGTRRVLNISCIVQPHKAWKYKHRWAFVYHASGAGSTAVPAAN